MHKHHTYKTETLPFSHCVNPRDCDPRAHGSVRYRDYCRCGAVRERNVNQNFKEVGQWQKTRP